MPSRTEASPSPPPTAPVLTEPGPRATALRKVFNNALTATLKANSYPNFSACFPTPAQYCPQALEGVWKQLNAKLEENCVKEFEGTIEERGVVRGLNEWDSAIERARVRKDRGVEGETRVGMHELAGEELYRAWMTPGLVEAEKNLQERLKTSQEENQAMMREILKQRGEIERLVGGLESMVGDVENSVKALQEGNIQGMSKDTWDMEMEIQATK
jgi:kinetochore protein NNF1